MPQDRRQRFRLSNAVFTQEGGNSGAVFIRDSAEIKILLAGEAYFRAISLDDRPKTCPNTAAVVEVFHTPADHADTNKPDRATVRVAPLSMPTKR